MKKSLEMFALPSNWKAIDEKYQLKNDQGLDFVANIVAPCGKVVTVFKAQPLMGLAGFDQMISDYAEVTSALKLKKKFNIKMKDKSLPIYIIEGDDKSLFMQAFLQTENGDVFSLLTFLSEGGKSFKEYSQKNPVVSDVVSLLRVVK